MIVKYLVFSFEDRLFGFLARFKVGPAETLLFKLTVTLALDIGAVVTAVAVGLSCVYLFDPTLHGGLNGLFSYFGICI